MKFSDLFTPRIMNSNPEVRKKAASNESDKHLLKQVMEQDRDEGVRRAARERLAYLEKDKVTA